MLGFGLDYDVFRDSGVHGSLVEEAVQGSPAFVTFEFRVDGDGSLVSLGSVSAHLRAGMEGVAAT